MFADAYPEDVKTALTDWIREELQHSDSERLLMSCAAFYKGFQQLLLKHNPHPSSVLRQSGARGVLACRKLFV
jgi:hypothetical protein